MHSKTNEKKIASGCSDSIKIWELLSGSCNKTQNNEVDDFENTINACEYELNYSGEFSELGQTKILLEKYKFKFLDLKNNKSINSRNKVIFLLIKDLPHMMKY